MLKSAPADLKIIAFRAVLTRVITGITIPARLVVSHDVASKAIALVITESGYHAQLTVQFAVTVNALADIDARAERIKRADWLGPPIGVTTDTLLDTAFQAVFAISFARIVALGMLKHARVSALRLELTLGVVIQATLLELTLRAIK